MILVSQTHICTIQDFICRYIELIETRLMMNFEIYSNSKTFEKMVNIFSYILRMKINPIKFLDYSFEMSDGLPFPERLQYYLQSYKENVKPNQKSIYEIVDESIQTVNRYSYVSLHDLYLRYRISPFLPACDDKVKYYVFQNKVSEYWITLDDDFEYFGQIKIAMLILTEFTKLRSYLLQHWVPTLEKRKNQ